MACTPLPAARLPFRTGTFNGVHVLPSSTDCSRPMEQGVVAVAVVAGQVLVRAHTFEPMALASIT